MPQKYIFHQPWLFNTTFQASILSSSMTLNTSTLNTPGLSFTKNSVLTSHLICQIRFLLCPSVFLFPLLNAYSTKEFYLPLHLFSCQSLGYNTSGLLFFAISPGSWWHRHQFWSQTLDDERKIRSSHQNWNSGHYQTHHFCVLTTQLLPILIWYNYTTSVWLFIH